jgi:lantibiotic transport system permease protein
MMLARTLPAELLKLRRTPALLLAASVPMFICVLYVLLFNLSESYRNLTGDPFWAQLLGITNFLWNTLMLPLGLAVLGGLVVGLEHSENQWKTLLTLPPSRASVYLAKCLTLAALTLFGSLVLLLGLALLAWVKTGFPPSGFELSRWNDLLTITVRAWVAILPLVALHIWFSSRIKSFAVPLGLAFAGTLSAMFATNGNDIVWMFVPWTYASTEIMSKYGTVQLVLSLGLFPIILLAGLWDFSRRDIQ